MCFTQNKLSRKCIQNCILSFSFGLPKLLIMKKKLHSAPLLPLNPVYSIQHLDELKSNQPASGHVLF